ncbi:hypothetical protein VSU01S_35270 [Vibrio superstes NBRC 103154]|uniref:HTH araC/xylS-type domain-containing protein n=1 Tax=Vibrio superstes NBRC 103154 TaxID=1219062 RepID=A0A511QXM7_9VIBR|nr:hypothetical protein VSU01S_35270 [Vibrio superstes NBRC 103154]
MKSALISTLKEIKKQAVLSKAAQLLAQSSESISDIAFRMGYSDIIPITVRKWSEIA